MIACPDKHFFSFLKAGAAGSPSFAALFHQFLFVLFFSVCGRRLKKYNRGVIFPQYTKLCRQNLSFRTFPRRGISFGRRGFYKYITIGGIQ